MATKAAMPLRRSSRVSRSVLPATTTVATVLTPATNPTLKRNRSTKTTKVSDTKLVNELSKDGSSNMPPPATPTSKRRRVAATDKKPAPFTPTPSAVGMMISSSPAPALAKISYSTGDIDDATPPPKLPSPGHSQTNVPIGGTIAPQLDHPDLVTTDTVHNASASIILEAACSHLIKQDARLQTVIDQNPCQVFSAAGLAEAIDPFRSLASGIIAQQVSGAAAKSIKNKFVNLYPPEHCPTGFPPPALVASTPITKLREAGLSQRKAEYIQGLAEKFDSGDLTIKMLMEGSDEEVMKKLVAVRGLGAWSVEMFMCFGLKRMDVFSTGDLGVQRGMAAYVGRDVKKLKAKGGGKWKYMSEKEMLEIAEKFRPYRSLFMWLMWRVEDVDVTAMQDN